MEINGKTIVYGLLILMIVGLIIFSLKIGNLSSKTQDQGSYSDIPEKCRPPKGESVSSWKEHLSHHAETRECLQYFK